MAIKKIFRLLFFLAAWGSIVFFISKNAASIKTLLVIRNPYFFTLSFLLLFPSFGFLFWCRHGLTKAFGLNIARSDNWRIFVGNMITRYIPGGVWNQLEAAVKLKKSSSSSYFHTGKLVFVEMMWRVMSGYLFFGLLIPNFKFPPFTFYSTTLYLGVILIAICGFWIASRKYPFIILYSWKRLFEQLVANFLFYTSNGLSFFLLILSFKPEIMPNVSVSEMFSTISASSLGWVAGFLFLIAPSGLGIREAVTGYLLSPIINVFAFGFSLTLVHRIMIVARDIIIFVITLSVSSVRKAV